MKQVQMGNFSPQRKTVSVNDKFGNTGIKNQQGSTVIKYDTLPLDGRTEYRFFEGAAQRNFPLSNTGSDGNKLGVGNSMVVERVYLSLVTFDIANRESITGIQPLLIGTTNGNILAAQFTFAIANTAVIKDIPVLSWVPQFNKMAENAVNTNFEFDTQVVIPPLLDYIASLRLPVGVTTANTSLRLTIEGAGAIISPRATF
jgi:hypothetical protein